MGGAPPSGGTGPVTAFDDTFDSGTLGPAWQLLDRGGDAGNKEAQCYRPQNAGLAGGLVTLTSKLDSTCAGFKFTSAMMQWSSQSFTYGTISVRAKLTGGGGAWPAIWLLGANCQATNVKSADNNPPCSWPNPGSDEIDIAEPLNGSRTNVNQQIHTASGNPGCSATTTDVSQNFHEYTLVWSKGSAVWKIDGATTCTIKESVPTTPMFLIINIAVGGVGGGTIDESVFPQALSVDRVTLTP
jgi:beta-glucanase (GH16 family)